MGVTVLVASGDNAASDDSTNGALTVDFPSSSPYMIGCGGTKLALTGNSIHSEQTWNELAQNEGATGGGVSEVYAAPAFQSGVNVPVAPNVDFELAESRMSQPTQTQRADTTCWWMVNPR